MAFQELSLPAALGESNLAALLDRRRSTRSFEDAPLTLAELAELLWAAQGRTSDGRGVSPSAHQLYPLAVSVVAGHVDGLDPGIYRYASTANALRFVAAGDFRDSAAAASLVDEQWLGQAAVVLVISADVAATITHFADQPPDGRRGERYVWLEAGCTVQNVYLRVTEAGLGAVLVGGFDDEQVSSMDPPILPARPIHLP